MQPQQQPPQPPQQQQPPMEPPSIVTLSSHESPAMRTLYFTIAGRHEMASFPADISTNELRELFRCAAEAKPGDVLKLYSSTGKLFSISPSLPDNTPESSYTLQVIATSCNGMLQRELGVDLFALEERVCQLEQLLSPEREEVSETLFELRKQIDSLRVKLENTEHLSWLGFNKELQPPPSSQALVVCDGLHKYSRVSDALRQHVREEFMKICGTAVSEDVRKSLRNVSFDSRQFRDEELLLLLQTMYLDLDLMSRFSLDLPTLRAFLVAVYEHYNDVPFHNFRHCFCVAQMMYAIAWAADLPGRIGDLATLILITSCICHDLDHPGYNNIYQINARTELALRYNDISPLENHHSSVAFQLLSRPQCNIFHGFSNDLYRQVREGIIRCILATDMARHNEILQQFREITPTFDFDNRQHTDLLLMVLIKVADISNEARPMEVAEPWLDRLLQEFFKQSDAEKLEGLPVTPFMDRDKVTKPSSQCSFIGLVLLPLFEALGDLLPELKDLIIKPVHVALDYYRRLNEAARERKSIDMEERRLSTAEGPSMGAGAAGAEGSGSPPLSRSSRQSCLTLMRSFEDSTSEDVAALAAATDSAADDGDTITEVEVSEKTLKFKISTETGPSRNNYRKSSFEKQTSFDDKLSASSPQHIQTPSTVTQNNGNPARNSLFSRLKCLRERLYGNYEKSPEKNSVKNRKKGSFSSGRRRSSSSSITELKQSASDDIANGKSEEKTLSASLDCVLSSKDKHSSRKGIFQRLRGGDKSPTLGNRSPGSKVASFVGSFRKRGREDPK